MLDEESKIEKRIRKFKSDFVTRLLTTVSLTDAGQLITMMYKEWLSIAGVLGWRKPCERKETRTNQFMNTIS